MSTRKFEDGTEVVHKSGGPVRIVTGYGLYGMAATREKYLCRWVDPKGQVHEDTFIEEELKPASPPNTGSVRLQRG